MVDQNYRSVTKGGLLTPAEIAETREISRELGRSYCRRCDYCQPCAQGVDISKIFIIYNYYTRYNMRDFALSQYGALKVGGDACVKCGRCAERCPYNLPIPEMIEKYVAEITAGN
jgi:predicted aldo/keto reductase-like oxidoreductase